MRENKKREKNYEAVDERELYRLAKSGDRDATDDFIRYHLTSFKDLCGHLISMSQFEIMYQKVEKIRWRYLTAEDFYWTWCNINKRESPFIRALLFLLTKICKEEKNREYEFMKRIINQMQSELKELTSIYSYALWLAFKASNEYEEMSILVWNYFREELGKSVGDFIKQESLHHKESETQPFEDSLLDQMISEESPVCDNNGITDILIERTFFIVRACLF